MSCLANLSSDEVFTPPKLTNEILDLLPNEIWNKSDLKFLDPVCKSGIFLREITKRLMEGLKIQIPDTQERLNHILKNQVYGYATTELTSLMSRRTLYCSKSANGKYSIVEGFENDQGNILYNYEPHQWKNEKCILCGVNNKILDRDQEYESYAYNFIHEYNLEENNMKFDVIVGNPPYQYKVGVEKKNYAVLIFQKFVQTAIKLNPTYLSMIIPSRWLTGGRGLDEFRNQMFNDQRLKEIVDYIDSRDCFNGVEVTGGAMYFLWDKNYSGECKYTSVQGDQRTTVMRKWNTRKIHNRYPQADEIINKIESKSTKFLSEIVSSQTPFGLHSTFSDKNSKDDNDVEVITSRGTTWTSIKNIKNNQKLINLHNVIITKATSEHAGQASKDGKRKVLAKISTLKPNQVCTQTYLIVDSFDNANDASLFVKYLKTKFARFLLLQAITSQDLAKDKFCFVPIVDYSQLNNDEDLYRYYNLSDEEQQFIENMIKVIED